MLTWQPERHLFPAAHMSFPVPLSPALEMTLVISYTITNCDDPYVKYGSLI
jgi:hypothetical protein